MILDSKGMNPIYHSYSISFHNTKIIKWFLANNELKNYIISTLIEKLKQLDWILGLYSKECDKEMINIIKQINIPIAASVKEVLQFGNFN